MFLRPELAGAQPLMVVGLPRCGTTFVTEAYNQHPEIALEFEIPHLVMDPAVDFLKAAAEHFRNRVRVMQNRNELRLERGQSVFEETSSWEVHRFDLLYAMWGSLGTRATETPPQGTIRWYGHKTPHHDRYWEFYRDFFGDRRPRYVFCMRSFVDNHLSRHAIRARPIRVSASDYVEAVNRYADMKEALGDDVSLFILDDLPAGGIDYLRTTLFDNLGIEVDAATLASIDPGRRVWSSEERGTSARDLRDGEQEFLAEHPELLTALDTLRAGKRI